MIENTQHVCPQAAIYTKGPVATQSTVCFGNGPTVCTSSEDFVYDDAVIVEITIRTAHHYVHMHTARYPSNIAGYIADYLSDKQGTTEVVELLGDLPSLAKQCGYDV
jgi:hypothetical protein